MDETTLSSVLLHGTAPDQSGLQIMSSSMHLLACTALPHAETGLISPILPAAKKLALAPDYVA
jgi:hypothetical protein